MMSRTFLSVGSSDVPGLEPEPDPLSAPLEVELVVLDVKIWINIHNA